MLVRRWADRAVSARDSAAAAIVRLLVDAGADVDAADPNGRSPLHGAIESGSVEAAALLLAAGADADARNILDEGNTPLLVAVGRGGFGTAKALLVASADPARANACGVAPLKLARMRASRSAQLVGDAAEGEVSPSAQREATAAAAMVALLLDFGAPYDARSKSGKTPLYLAAQQGDFEEVGFLLAEGAAVDRPIADGATPLQVACQQGQFSTAALLLEHGACPRGRRESGGGDGVFGAGFPPLHLACLGTAGGAVSCDLVRLLLECAADPNEACPNGNTPLRILAMLPSIDMPRPSDGVEPLDFRSLSPLEASSPSTSPLGMRAGSEGGEGDAEGAAEGGEGEEVAQGRLDRGSPELALSPSATMASLLLAAGADPDAADSSGRTAVWLATSFGALALLRTVLAAGQANPHLEDRSGVPPLWVAAARGFVPAALMLLRHGALVDAWDRNGCPPLCVACQQGELGVVELLLTQDADVELTDAFGNSPLLLAAQQGHLPCVRLLLQGNASPDTANELGVTPLQAAFDEGYSSIVGALREAGADTESLEQRGKKRFEHPMHGLSHFIQPAFGHVPTYMPPDADGVSSPRLLVAGDGPDSEALAYQQVRPRAPTPATRWIDVHREELDAEDAANARQCGSSTNGLAGDDVAPADVVAADVVAADVVAAVAEAPPPAAPVEAPADEVTLGGYGGPIQKPVKKAAPADRKAELAARRAQLEADRAQLQAERELKAAAHVIRFQARLRGYKARKERIAKREAAIRVQAASRGRATRRARRVVADNESGLVDDEMAKSALADDAEEDGEGVEEADLLVGERDEEKAAVVVQAAMRGHATRLRQVNTNGHRPMTPVDDEA